MALRTLHLCLFGFKDRDFRRIGNTTDGGTSLSGISDTIETDGGGFWQYDLTNGSARDATSGKAWRGLVEYLSGGTAAVDVLVCERLFQPNPVGVRRHDLTGPLLNPDAYGATSTSYTAAAAPLRATAIQVATDQYALPIEPGNLFAILHPSWGWRAYRVRTVEGSQVTFRPPLREAIAANTPLDFDNPRCRMHHPAQLSNATNMGRFTSCALTLVEDMRPPQ